MLLRFRMANVRLPCDEQELSFVAPEDAGRNSLPPARRCSPTAVGSPSTPSSAPTPPASPTSSRP